MNELLLATLGTEPQGVTWMLDWLLQQGFAIDEVLVLHTSASVVEAALPKLEKEFPTYYPSIRFHHEVIRRTDIVTWTVGEITKNHPSRSPLPPV